MKVRRPSQVFTAIMVVAFLSGCASSTASQTVATVPTYTFTCCSSSDLSRPWNAGEEATLHWLVKPGALTADDRIHPIIITTVLAGPYADIGSLKSARPALKTLHPVTISTNDRTPSLPASVFSLPADLPPGFYNLTFKFDYGGGNSAGGGSVVQVSSRP